MKCPICGNEVSELFCGPFDICIDCLLLKEKEKTQVENGKRSDNV